MKQRINIASFGGRTHLLDTARELDEEGFEVRFYSFVPDKRAIQFGLRKECNYSLLWFAWPYLIWLKLFGFGGWGTLVYMTLCDWLLCIYMKPCDVLIGQSPMHYNALKYAKKKWNATTILERGTSHILEFRKHLSEFKSYNGIFDRITLHQDSKAYNIPDYISIGSEHVKDSFTKNGIAAEKLFVNNYGFAGDNFHPTELSGDYDILMVGTWSYRKGCDLIAKACRQKGYKCLHVGDIIDKIDSSNPNITHIASVAESKLINYYKQAKVFVLPSREEGLALVQCQAAACGLPIVCSKYSGGRDIREYADRKEFIIEIEDYSAEALSSSIDEAIELADSQNGIRNYMGKGLDDITFKAYGKRYADFLRSIK